MKSLTSFCLIILPAAGIVQAQDSFPTERAIKLSIEINSPIDSVWARWTTSSGRAKFLAPSSRLEGGTLGYMEILFSPQAPEGQRGAENNRVLAMQKNQLLSFTWDAPPTFPEIRKQRTVVIMRFYKLTENKTLLTFMQVGWGTGAEWDTVYGYFSKAWANMVLPNLKYSLEVQPVDLTNFPANVPKNLPPAKEWKD
jgi:uncharacterized protein YndB with AHSA1/START domain